MYDSNEIKDCQSLLLNCTDLFSWMIKTNFSLISFEEDSSRKLKDNV
jgi:hypothetical protein